VTLLDATRRLHFAGIAGSGMSALAQCEAFAGRSVSGSDRAFDRGQRREERAFLEALGVRIYPQDGSALDAQPTAVVMSTAVEESVPDVRLARERGVPLLHRSELLAEQIATHRTIAVAGTSGKSTVVAMIFEILRGASPRGEPVRSVPPRERKVRGASPGEQVTRDGTLRENAYDPSVITGGELLALRRAGYWGNAWVGASDLLVVEADESDGSLVRYKPVIGVLLNLQRDHHEPSTVAEMFAQFAAHTRERLIVSGDPALASFRPNALTFGVDHAAQAPALDGRTGRASADILATDVMLHANGSRFTVRGVSFDLPAPGLHNVRNAVAAIAACHAVGVPLEAMAAPLARFAGVHRRFEVVGHVGGIEVVDDFAHNPDKIRAALATAALRGRRTLAVFQPHGFGPTRFLRADLVRAFAEALRSEDRLWLLEIFYAGGTAARDISSADLAREILECGRVAEVASDRTSLAATVAAHARAGDVVLVMGARDPSLSDLARALLDACAAQASAAP
jgi:UDP-N-acetylmuramate--alanine ligase